jgi:hypothetical protein
MNFESRIEKNPYTGREHVLLSVTTDGLTVDTRIEHLVGGGCRCIAVYEIGGTRFGLPYNGTEIVPARRPFDEEEMRGFANEALKMRSRLEEHRRSRAAEAAEKVRHESCEPEGEDP